MRTAWKLGATRIGLASAALLTAIGIFFLVQKGSGKLVDWISNRHERYFRKLSYRNYTYLAKERELALMVQLVR